MATIVVVQARMASTRLPGKVLRPLGGRPVLGWIVRAAQAADVGDVVVATSTQPDDDAVVATSAALGVRVVRGDHEDVLARFVAAIDGADDGDAVVRLTADCPLLDPAVVTAVVTLRDLLGVDYASTDLRPSLPRGLDAEVTSARILRELAGTATGADRAHVTSAIYRDGSGYSCAGLHVTPRADDLRVTLDTPEDARLLDALVAVLGDAPPDWRSVVDLLRSSPELAVINAAVAQKDPRAG